MASDKPDILMMGPPKPVIADGLAPLFNVHRLVAFGVPVVYHTRNADASVPYRHYPRLIDMARDADTLLAIVPGGAGTRNMINAEVLEALGPRGIVINMARGSVVDEAALIRAL